MGRKKQPLGPRDGKTLVVGIVARISGRPNQKELSLEDQEDHGKQVVDDMYEGPVVYRVVSTTGKGERLDRPELAQIEAMLRTRKLDLLVVEDIGRMVRGADAVRLCGIAVDHGTRVIAPNDCIDTAEDSWEEDAIQACRDHVGHNSNTSKRLKQKLMNRFVKWGGAMARPIYGYVKPDDAETYSDWSKDDAATAVYAEWFERLREVPNCSLLADWLNAGGVPTGPYADNEKWDGRMVASVTRNPLLKGLPGRGFRHTVKHHGTGRRVSVPNPDGPEYRDCPHLAHVEPALWDEVNALLVEQNRGLGRKPVDGTDPLAGRPKKRTVWPGQHVLCGVCGRPYYWGGHGQADHMMCSGVRDYACWNAATFDGRAAAGRLAAALLSAAESLPDFDEAFLAKVAEAASARSSGRAAALERLGKELAQAERESANLVESLAKMGYSEDLHARHLAASGKKAGLARERAALLREPEDVPALPPLEELKSRARVEVGRMASGEPEFGRMMHRLLPRIEVFPHQLLDGGKVVLRARVTIDLAPLLGPASGTFDVVLSRTVVVDLFDPPQREAYRDRIVALRNAGRSEREAARELGLTATAAQHAMALQRLMAKEGVADAYRALTAPPERGGKIRRHEHPRYDFRPLDGYPARPDADTP